MHRRPWTYAFLITTIAGALMALADQLLDGSVWEVFYVPPKTITYFCETSHVEAFIRQPANTYTNLGYLFVAVLMLAFTRRAVSQAEAEDRSFLGRYPIYGYLYAACMLYTFIGSSMFHASLGRLPEQIDLGAVYASGAIPLTFGLHKGLEVRKIAVPLWVFMLIFSLWAFASLVFAWHMTARIVFPGMLVAAGICVGFIESSNGRQTPWKWIVYLIASVLAATFFFIADIARIGCVPDGLMHPHGIWHFGAASAAVAMFGYMYVTRTESGSEIS